MRLDNNFKRALKGLVINKLVSYKHTFVVYPLIVLGISLLGMMLTFILNRMNIPTGSVSGVLSFGITFTYIIMIILTISSSTRSEIKKRFVYPINRKVYAAGNFIILTICSFMLLAGMLAASMVEMLAAKLIAVFYPSTILVDTVTITSLLAGLWVTFSYAMLLLSVIYLINMFILRFKIRTAAILIVFGLMFIIPWWRSFTFDILSFFIFEQSVIILSIKLLLTSSIVYWIGCLPLKEMEVNI
ncbi:MAG: hypothetical protein N2484_09550 [Clostridia bacterium]|nr:hypothetical protein [Clostridia bacterium]